ncbi:hypothetical protein J4402_04670 [Candidatus Pacearchaeota archaeon]|nr:hypothetical protein [Candidatus Pacearchaeota archaeon]
MRKFERDKIINELDPTLRECFMPLTGAYNYMRRTMQYIPKYIGDREISKEHFIGTIKVGMAQGLVIGPSAIFLYALCRLASNQ